jgi:hypothetical protein
MTDSVHSRLGIIGCGAVAQHHLVPPLRHITTPRPGPQQPWPVGGLAQPESVVDAG